MFYETKTGTKPKAKRDSIGEGDETNTYRSTRSTSKEVGNSNTGGSKVLGAGGKRLKY